MARPVNHRCAACARQSLEKAKEKECWVASSCHRRRSHYRKRREKNAERRLQYRLRQGETMREGPVELAVPVPEVKVRPVAIAVVYSPPAGGVHAIAFEVWQGEKKVATVPPVHCHGWDDAALDQYVKEALRAIGQRFPVESLASRRVLPAAECPIPGCPFVTPR